MPGNVGIDRAARDFKSGHYLQGQSGSRPERSDSGPGPAFASGSASGSESGSESAPRPRSASRSGAGVYSRTST